MLLSSARKYLALGAVLLILVGASGCGGEESLPPEQVIEKASTAIKSANSFHFNLATSKTQKPVPGLFITGADGDVAKPDKLAGDLSATFGGLPIEVKVIVDGKSQYMTDPASGKWSAMSAAFNVAEFFDPSRGVADILTGVKDLKGDGKESIDGTDTYRLKGTVPSSALSAFSPEVTAQSELTATMWIGSSDFLLRKATLEGPLIASEPADLVRTITFKDYTKEVKVETPVVGEQ
jgi:lipoprotein LprG